VLGPSPQPALAAYPLSELARVYEVNVLAPLALVQQALPRLVDGAAILDVSSDAAVEPYQGWGGYGSSKAALEQLTAVLAVEQPQLRVYSVDPGDMRTQTYQEAFPGEDISNLPPPEESVPGLLALIEGSLASGRYRARELGPAPA
jgi:NAD(P)-dependent dehydrogenase (short-subunit alcohol dehydrogenase family)